jgi:sucrose phosphorylase
VYYVGALAGDDDMALLARTGVGRDINRHHYPREEIAEQVRRPVVAALLALARFRNAHPAFGGEAVVDTGPHTLALRWHDGADRAELEVDARARTAVVRWTERGEVRATNDLLAAPPVIGA